MSASELLEFRFVYGDPRPTLVQYLVTQELYTPLACTLDSQNWNLQSIFEIIKEHDHDGASEHPFIFAPIVVTKNKNNTRSKHMMYVMYNCVTKELERIDIRKYHIDGYKISDIGDELRTFVDECDDVIDLVPDLDAPNAFAANIGLCSQRDAYPLYVIAYLHERLMADANATSKEIRDYVLSLSADDVRKYWETYKSFINSLHAQSKADHVYNPETGKFIKIGGPTYQNMAIPDPETSTLCLMIDEAMATDYSDDMVLEHAAPHLYPMKSVELVNNIFRKHPQIKAKFITGTTKIATHMREIRISWKADSEEIEFPKGFTDKWIEAIDNKKGIQFVFVFVSLIKKGLPTHANVLVYDVHKNEMERFDSLGCDLSKGYNVAMFDRKLAGIFSDVKYFAPRDYFPSDKSVFQSKEMDTSIVDPNELGNCAVWRLWYIDIRLANPDVDRETLVKKAARELDMRVGNMLKFIKSYQTLYALQV